MQLWDLVRHLPPDSATGRRLGMATPLEENLATLLDLLFHQVVTDHRQATFNPDRWAEHAALAKEAGRRDAPPPPAIPLVTPVALRPAGARSLTEALTKPTEPVVEELEGHEAHVRLQAVIAGMTTPT